MRPFIFAFSVALALASCSMHPDVRAWRDRLALLYPEPVTITVAADSIAAVRSRALVWISECRCSQLSVATDEVIATGHPDPDSNRKGVTIVRLGEGTYRVRVLSSPEREVVTLSQDLAHFMVTGERPPDP